MVLLARRFNRIIVEGVFIVLLCKAFKWYYIIVQGILMVLLARRFYGARRFNDVIGKAF